MLRRALFVVVLVALVAPRSFAQGTGGLLPDPISTGDLIEWFEDLNATAEQRAAILALHDEYLVKCRELREGRIEALLNKDREVWATSFPGALIVRSELADFLRERSSLWKGSDIKKDFEQANDRGLDARLDLIELNRRIVDEIAEAIANISRTDAEMLRRAYRRNAYPAVYDDPDFGGPLLERAMEIEGITDPQMRDIVVLLVGFEHEYEAHSMEICGVFNESQFQGLSGAGPQSWPDLTTRREQIEKLKFYRREVSDRAKLALKDILTPEQWEALTATPEVLAAPN